MLKFVVEGILVPVITGFGLAGNIASMLVLRSPKLDMKVSIRHILMMLALFDSLFIMFTTLSFSLLQLYPGWKTYYHGIVFPWIFPFIQISLTGSIWSTVSVAVERFLSVVYSRTWISTLSSRVYLIPVLLISILWNIPRFLELQTCYHVKPSVASLQILQDMNSTDPTPAEIKQFNQSLEDAQRTYTNSYNQSITDENPTLCPTKMRNDPMYIRYYILLANFFMMGLLPFIILAVTNFLLYKTVTSSSTLASRATARQKRDQSIAKMLVFIVVVFVCCNVVRMVLNLYEVLQALLVGANGPLMEEWPDWCNALAMLSTLLLTLNSSTNILIYCWKDKTFRDQLFITLGLKKLSHTQSIMMTTLTVSAGVAERRAVVV